VSRGSRGREKGERRREKGGGRYIPISWILAYPSSPKAVTSNPRTAEGPVAC
jgi:hypothetical protein